MQHKGFDLRMLQFVVSTSIFYYANTFSLALAAVSRSFDFQLDKIALRSWRHLLPEQNGNTPFE